MTSRLTAVAAATVGITWIGIANYTTRSNASFGFVGCPFKHLTELDCPGCGSTRAIGALTRLDVRSALDHNVLVPLAALFVVVAWATWTWAIWHGRARTDLIRGRLPIIGVGVVLVGFAVIRNLAVGEWLASGIASSP